MVSIFKQWRRRRGCRIVYQEGPCRYERDPIDGALLENVWMLLEPVKFITITEPETLASGLIERRRKYAQINGVALVLGSFTCMDKQRLLDADMHVREEYRMEWRCQLHQALSCERLLENLEPQCCDGAQHVMCTLTRVWWNAAAPLVYQCPQ